MFVFVCYLALMFDPCVVNVRRWLRFCYLLIQVLLFRCLCLFSLGSFGIILKLWVVSGLCVVGSCVVHVWSMLG